jgi:hypothetical protein
LGGDGDKKTESGVGASVSAAAVRATGEPDGGAVGGGSEGSEKGKDKRAGKGPASSGPSTGSFTMGGMADRSTPGGWLVGAQLGETEKQQVTQVVEKNRDVFAFSSAEIGEFKLFKVQLDLKTDQPIYERRRKHSIREWELVDERCVELEKAGIIEECDSDFAANSVMAAKKDPASNWKLAHFCTGLRRVNEQTSQDRYPMHLPEDVLEGLGHAKFYSTINIRGAFHQLVVRKENRKKLAFWSSNKLYCWKRCPFEAQNASAWFQRAIDQALRGCEVFARSFINDLLVAGRETAEEHMKLVQQVFDRLRDVGLKCHPKK